MASKEQTIMAFLLDPASCRIYSNETRQAKALDRPQTEAEAAAAKRIRPVDHRAVGEPAYQAVKARADHREVTPRTPTETLALLGKLARRGARPDYLRTDPWEGIDVNPWRITEKERIRFGLGPFR